MTTKIPPKIIKEKDAKEAFSYVANVYQEYIETLQKFHELPIEDQKQFLLDFGKDMNALLLILWEYTNPRTDDVEDRGNQI
jgi:hypothetical protein